MSSRSAHEAEAIRYSVYSVAVIMGALLLGLLYLL
jgi:hypothetical protein